MQFGDKFQSFLNQFGVLELCFSYQTLGFPVESRSTLPNLFIPLLPFVGALPSGADQFESIHFSRRRKFTWCELLYNLFPPVGDYGVEMVHHPDSTVGVKLQYVLHDFENLYIQFPMKIDQNWFQVSINSSQKFDWICFCFYENIF